MEIKLDVELIHKLDRAGYKFFLNRVGSKDAWFFISPNGERSVLFARFSEMLDALQGLAERGEIVTRVDVQCDKCGEWFSSTTTRCHPYEYHECPYCGNSHDRMWRWKDLFYAAEH